jgi:nitroreductase
MIKKKLKIVKGKLSKILYVFFIKIASKNPFASSLYYLFISKEFYNEHYVMINGIRKNLMHKNNIGNFRRNIHRLEKGLITKPPKPVFAQDYIINTVEVLHDLYNSDIDKNTINWAIGTLTEYFNIAPFTEINLKAKKIFQSFSIKERQNMPKTFHVNNRINSQVTYTDFLALNKQRRSIRYFENISVPRELIEKAVVAALEAPSACNRQPFTFRVVDDPIMLSKVLQLPLGAKTFSNHIKMMVFVVGDQSNYFSERDKHLIYIDSSLVTMNFILALETLKLSSCIINWADIQESNSRLKEILALEDWEQCVLSIAVGYAALDCGIASSIKKNAQTIIKYN